MRSLLSNHKRHRKLSTLVENKTTYSSAYAELNIYETHACADKVSLTFDFPIIASMLTGKKIMHLDGLEAFDFSPGESVVMPKHKEMVIDFPTASLDNPTQCLALGIDTDKVEEIVEKFNHSVRIENENDTWNLEKTPSHIINNEDVSQLVQRLTHTFTNTNESKDVLLDLMIQELIVRLLQTRAKSIIIEDVHQVFSDTRIGTVIKYIKKHLTDKNLSVNILAEKAHMSHSHFHRQFKNTLGISPIDFINSEKVKFSKKLILASKDLRMSEIAFKSGFNNASYFNRQFKKMELMTPQQFKKSMIS